MKPERTCPDCGATLPADAPRGLCPNCLMGAALPSTSPPSHEATGTFEPTTGTFEPAGTGVLDTIAQSVGPVPRVLLRDTAPGEPPGPVVRPDATDADPSIRYRIDGEIARGGMGAILKGRDPDLGRDVAIKVLRADLRDKADLVRRFVEEAQIGGQLQHPGVVPIYELGTFADRRPFFSMKLVKGKTLADLLAARSGPANDLPRFLSIFAAIAQTMAYSHTRGVIHRDLKPSNVMVGSFGEVQVMDWGLARVLPRGGVAADARAGQEPPEETLITTAGSGSDRDLSRAGSIMGTPSYMPPEQSRGQTDRIDERADVFALGSILCEILSGEPAFLGRSSGEILRKAALGDTADALARLGACGADADLVAIAVDCLAREVEDRPRHAGEVAERVTAYLTGVQDRLRQSELAEAEAKARAVEEAKRRRLTVVLAATALLALMAGGGGYVRSQQQKAERQTKTAHVVEEALADAARLRGEAQAARPVEPARWAEAISAARRAEGLLAQGEANAPLKARVTAWLAQLAREQAAAAEQARRLEVDHALLAALEALRGRRAEHLDPKQTDADYAAAFCKAGLDLDATRPDEAGKWLAARSEPVELAGYLDDWYLIRKQDGRAEADWRRLVEAARAADPDPWRDALRAKVLTRDGQAAAEFRRLADDAKALDGQSAPSLILLARQLIEGAADRERAARVLRRAVSRHPSDFWAHIELGRLYGADSGTMWEVHPQPEEAVRHLTAAVAIRPNSPVAHGNFGLALESQGKLDEAVAEYRESIRLKPDDNSAHFNLFAAFKILGQMDEAVATCRESIRLNPNDPYAHLDMGLALREQGEYAEAAAELRQAIRLKPDDARFHNNLGLALWLLGKLDEAAAAYREAIRLKPDFTEAHLNLGYPLLRQGKFDEAAAAYREAIRLKPEFAVGHQNLGMVLQAQGKLDEAIAEYRTETRLKPKFAGAHYNLGNALKDQGKLDEAIAEYRTAIRLQPKFAGAHYNLGNALKDQGKLDEAIAEYRTTIRLQPDHAEALCNLGIFLQQRGAHAEGLEMLRKGHELGSRRPDWQYPSARWVAEAERAPVLANRLTAVLRGEDKPKDNAERLNFARFARDQRLFGAATRLWAEALASDPQLGDDRRWGHRYEAACAAALAGSGQGKDHPPLDDAAKATLRGQARDWLKAELTAWAKFLESGTPQAQSGVVQNLQHWARVPDLAGIRDAEALARLPADEQKAWRTLWADVDSLRTRAGSQETAAAAHIATAPARGQSLGLGDPAPKLDVKSFVKGQPIATLEPGKLYVVEFWATWCGPCRVSIPHLTGLQKKHPDVAFIGVSIWEQDQNAVKPFVDKMGDQMAYRVAIDAIPEKGDANDGIMATKWMKAAGQGGIPTAFIIDKGGRIAWIGHPMSMDEPLEKIVNGSWDLTAASARSRKESENRAAIGLEAAVAGLRNEIQLRPGDGGLYSNYGRLLGYLGRHDEAIEACRKAIKLNPNDGGAHYNLGNSLAAQGRLRDALAAFGEAQRVEPSLSQSRQWQLLYHAACAAARAAAGTGKDEPPPDDAAKVKLRRQALDWLRAEYKSWDQLLEFGGPQARPSIADALRHWKQESDFAGIRDDEALARLPEAERKEWQALWTDVDSLQSRAATPIPTETKTSRTGPTGQDDVKADSLEVLESLHRRAHELAASKPAEAEPLFRQVLEGYRKLEGPDGALTLDLTLDLANLLDQTGRGPEAEPLFRAGQDGARKRFGADDPRTAGVLAARGLSLVRRGQWAEAEPVLRESLAIRAKVQPDEWTTFNTRSLLGGSLLGQKKYADAEPLIVAGYEGMKAREAKIPPPGKPRFTEAAERVVRLYEAWGKKEKAAEWRAKLAKPSAAAGKQP